MLVMLDKWSSYRGGRLSRSDCISSLKQKNHTFACIHAHYLPYSIFNFSAWGSTDNAILMSLFLLVTEAKSGLKNEFQTHPDTS